MAIEIAGLDQYSLITLGDNKLKIVSGGFGYGPDQLFFLLFPEEKTLEEIETIIKNPKNTKKIIISDKEEQSIYATLENYCEVTNIEKKFQEAYYFEYDKQGNVKEYYTDIYKIILRKSTVPSQLTKLQSDLEYVAIMSDIDIDEDIYQ